MSQVVPGMVRISADQDLKLLDLNDLRRAGEVHRVQHGVELRERPLQPVFDGTHSAPCRQSSASRA